MKKKSHSLVLPLLLLVFLTSACAHRKTEGEAPLSEPVSTVSEQSRFFSDQTTEDSIQWVTSTHLSESASELKDLESVSITLGHALVRMDTEHVKKGKSTIDIKLLTPSDNAKDCVAAIRKKAGKFEIASKNQSLNCVYQIDMALYRAVATAVVLQKGEVDAEHWSEKLKLNVHSGDIDLGQVGPVEVVCHSCTLTGQEVSGPVQYKIETGNIGLEGLENPLEGETYGDTILVWKKISKDLKIKVKSKGGDVAMQFPSGARISPSVHVERGEVVYQLKGMKSGDEKPEHGVPVEVDCQVGNVKLYQAGQSTKRAR